MSVTTLNVQVQSTNQQFWNPGFILDDVYVWHDVADANTVILNGSNVSGLNDKSLNGIDIIQATAAAQPAYNSNQLNGLPVITFDGVDDFLAIENTDAFTSSDVSFIILARPLSVNHNAESFVSYSGGALGDWEIKANNDLQFDGLLDVGGISVGASDVSYNQTNVTSWALWGFDSEPGVDLITYFNGVQQGQDTNFNQWDLTNIDYKFGANRGTGRFLNCEIAEAIMFPTQYRVLIQNYFIKKWGL